MAVAGCVAIMAAVCFFVSWKVTFLDILTLLLSYPFNNQLSPPEPLWSRTAKWREEVKVGDEVEVRESTSLVQRPKWHRATVLALGSEEDIPRELEGGAELELLEMNEVGKRVPLTLLKRKRQVRV